MFEQIVSLIGKPLNDPDLQVFMTEHGFKPPKKPEISGRSSERDFWIEHKKLGVNLLFSIDIKSPAYTPVAGSKKGLFVPILEKIEFLNNAFDYPLGLKIGLNHDETVNILGLPSYKSSDIAKIWLQDDGSESFYGWTVSLEKTKHIQLHTRITVNENIDSIDVGIIEFKSMFLLFDVLCGESLNNFLADNNHFNQTGMFMEWAIKNGLYLGQANEQTGIAAVKNGLSMHEFFQQHVNTTNIYLPYFAPAQQQFVRQYVNNMSGHDVYFDRDYMLSFLTNNADRNNYLGDDAQNTLAKLAYSDENKAKIFAMLAARLAEFNAHGFAKSVTHLRP